MKVYQCEGCKKTIISKTELKLDGWKELIAGSTDAAQEKHVPVVSVNANKVKVDVGSVTHPMTAEHLIEWVAVETETGYQVGCLKANGAPMYEFTLNEGEKLLAVYAYCNLHGLWKAN